MTREPYVTGEAACSGTFFRAARRDDTTLEVGPSAPSIDGALTELDRDAGGPQVRAREPIPGEPTFRPHAPRVGALAMIAMLTTACATLSPADALEETQARTEEARQAVEGLAVAVGIATTICASLGEQRPDECALLERVPLDKARDALRDAAAAQATAQEVLRALAPYADAAQAVIGKAD